MTHPHLHPMPQGGAAPQPLPAPRPARRHRIRRVVVSLPPLIRTGFALLSLGVVADVAYHATHGLRPHTHSAGLDLATGIHLVVAAGMAVTLAGLVVAGIRSNRTSSQGREAIR